jgi:hypothetical protein
VIGQLKGKSCRRIVSKGGRPPSFCYGDRSGRISMQAGDPQVLALRNFLKQSAFLRIRRKERKDGSIFQVRIRRCEGRHGAP